jgi:hypothetical protein
VEATPAGAATADPQVYTWAFTDLMPGESQVITLTARLPAECLTSTYVNNVLAEGQHLGGECPDANTTADDSAQALVTCLVPDVSIEKTVTPTSGLFLGDEYDVTLLVTNTGTSVLNPVVVTDDLDPGVGFDEMQVIGGSCGATVASFAGQVITFTGFSLGVGESCEITYKVVCNEAGRELPDVATVTAYCDGTFPDNPVEDSDDAFFSCEDCVPQIDIDKTIAPASGNVEEAFTVTLVISNPGTTPNDDLDPVIVTDLIDVPGVSFDEFQTIGGTCGVGVDSYNDATGLITFESFALAGGASCTIVYDVICELPGRHPDVATATGYCVGTFPDNPATATDDAFFDCECPVDVEIDKVLSPVLTSLNGEIEVTLTITNTGQSTLDPVIVTDELDEFTGFDDTQTIVSDCMPTPTASWDPATRTITFSSFVLEPGMSCDITYIVTCLADGQRPDIARVTGFCYRDDSIFAEDFDEEVYECRTTENCPRTPGFWSQQTGDPVGGAQKFTTAEMTSIIDCIKAETDVFDSEFNTVQDFADRVGNPGPFVLQAKRQFAAFMANICNGQLGITANNGATVGLDASTPIDCYGLESETLGELVDEVDDLLMDLDGEDPKDRDVKHAYTNIISCLDDINNGRSIDVSMFCEPQEEEEETRSDVRIDGPIMGMAGQSNLKLYQANPNPFNGSTRLAYAVEGDVSQQVSITVFDVAGRQVQNLVDEYLAPGRYETVWDGNGNNGQARSGVYFLRVQIGTQTVKNVRMLYLP